MHKLLAFCLILAIITAISTKVVELASSDEMENTWTTMLPLPIGVAGAKAAVVDGRIYVIVSSVNYEYDPATDTWAKKILCRLHVVTA
jgi:hypothetical protein